MGGQVSCQHVLFREVGGRGGEADSGLSQVISLFDGHCSGEAALVLASLMLLT